MHLQKYFLSILWKSLKNQRGLASRFRYKNRGSNLLVSLAEGKSWILLYFYATIFHKCSSRIMYKGSALMTGRTPLKIRQSYVKLGHLILVEIKHQNFIGSGYFGKVGQYGLSSSLKYDIVILYNIPKDFLHFWYLLCIFINWIDISMPSNKPEFVIFRKWIWM